MFTMNLYYAKVTANDDTTSPDKAKLSRVQVRLLPEMEGIDIDLLPWARPFLVEGMNSSGYSHNPPEIGSSVWVVSLEKTIKKDSLYYIAGAFIDGHFSPDAVKSKIDSISEVSYGNYSDMKFRLMPDGSVFFWNNVNSNMGIYHKSGSYAVFNGSGEATIKSAKTTVTSDTTIVNSADVTITGGKLTVEGLSQPDPAKGGPFCAIPKCLFTGVPHTGNIVNNT